MLLCYRCGIELPRNKPVRRRLTVVGARSGRDASVFSSSKPYCDPCDDALRPRWKLRLAVKLSLLGAAVALVVFLLRSDERADGGRAASPPASEGSPRRARR